MKRCLLLVLLVLPLLGSDSPKEYDDKTEILDVEGTWRRTEFQFNGEKRDLPYESVMILRGGSYTRNDSNGTTLRGSYHIDPTCNPPHIDWFPSDEPFKGQTFRFIYQIDGDTLREAGIPGAQYTRRPQGFKDKDIEICTYKHVQK